MSNMPVQQKIAVAKYIAGKTIKRQSKYPLVLELEPLLQCNLACAGCGKIQHPTDILRRRLSVNSASRPWKSAARRWYRSPAASR